MKVKERLPYSELTPQDRYIGECRSQNNIFRRGGPFKIDDGKLCHGYCADDGKKTVYYIGQGNRRFKPKKDRQEKNAYYPRNEGDDAIRVFC